MMPNNMNMLAGLSILAIGIVLILLSIAINVFVCFLLQQCYNRIPPQFRQQQPGMVWLLLIPCFAIIWNFFVFPPLSKSFKAYYDSINRTDVGDCQESIGLALLYLQCGFHYSLSGLFNGPCRFGLTDHFPHQDQ